MRPESKSALLISYGVGVTAQALTETESLRSIDIVDISKNVVELSEQVMALPRVHPLHDPRVRVHIEDGRFFVLATRKRYDIITGEPPPPKNAGIANLYSREYFQLLHDRLNPGGVATYWLPVYQLRIPEAKAIVGAFCAAFPDCTLWTGAGADWMLAGSHELSERVSAEGFQRQWSSPIVGARLRSIGVETPEQMGALFVGDAAFLAAWVSETPPLEDNFPQRLEARMPSEVERSVSYPELLRVMDADASSRRFRDSEWIRRVWPSELRERTLAFFPHQRTVNQHLAEQTTGIPELHAALTRSNLVSLPLMLMGSDLEEWPTIDKTSRDGVEDPMLEYLLAAHALSRQDFNAGLAHLERALLLDPDSEELARFRILACILTNDESGAREYARELRASERGAQPQFWSWLSMTLGEPL